METRLAELNRLYPVWEKKTIWSQFEETAARVPDQDFIVMGGWQTYSYRQAKEASLRIARALYAIGVRPGAHAAVQLANSPDQILIALALARLRTVKIPVNDSLGTCELNFVLEQSQASLLITDCQITLSGKAGHLKHIIVLESGHCKTDRPVLQWQSLLAGRESQVLPSCGLSAYADEVSDIVYTSGSTSPPKGVMLTHDMLLRSAFASCLNRGFELGRRVFVPLPMFHVYGYVEGMLAAILVGGAVLLWKGKFVAEQTLDFMEAASANDILCVPAQAIALMKYLEQTPRSLPELHAVYCSAAVCPAWVWPGIRAALQVSDVITGYGMTEVCGASMQTAPTDADLLLETQVGRLLPGGCSGFSAYGGHQIAYRVMDRETGQECPAGRAGELWCRGPIVTKGYFNRPEINKKAFTIDGWFKTGDCGYFDDAGYLILAGRIDDVYKINGENVSPKYLEDIFGKCDAVRAIEIVGIPDERHGYVGVAFLQLHEDSEENRAAVEQFGKKYMAKFQIPRHFIYMGDADWPRTSTGKVQKFRLREMAAGMGREESGVLMCSKGIT